MKLIKVNTSTLQTQLVTCGCSVGLPESAVLPGDVTSAAGLNLPDDIASSSSSATLRSEFGCNKHKYQTFLLSAYIVTLTKGHTVPSKYIADIKFSFVLLRC